MHGNLQGILDLKLPKTQVSKEVYFRADSVLAMPTNKGTETYT
jgi:hypothetical protein